MSHSQGYERSVVGHNPSRLGFLARHGWNSLNPEQPWFHSEFALQKLVIPKYGLTESLGAHGRPLPEALADVECLVFGAPAWGAPGGAGVESSLGV